MVVTLFTLRSVICCNGCNFLHCLSQTFIKMSHLSADCQNYQNSFEIYNLFLQVYVQRMLLLQPFPLAR